MVSLNLFERGIALAAPGTAYKRYMARLALDQAISIRRFDAAKLGRRTEGWFAPTTDGTSATLYGLKRMRARSRDLYRNNPLAHRACEVIVSNTIGTGIVPRFGPLDADAAPEVIESTQAAWNAWSGSREVDADGRCNFEALQALAVRTIVQSGSVLIRRRERRLTDGLTVPLQIQVLEPDFLATDRDGRLQGGNIIEGGVEIDRLGRRVAYHLYKEHPGGSHLRLLRSREVIRVPAKNIEHVFLQRRPGQVDDAPWGVSGFMTMRDLSDFQDAMLLRAKLAACWTAFVTNADGSEGSTVRSGSVDAQGRRIASLEPGAVEYLQPGEGIEFPDVPSGSSLSEYEKSAMRMIATAYGITYEAMTGDLSGVSFISGRMGWIEMNRNLTVWRRHLVIPGLCEPILRWFTEAAMMAGIPADAAKATWSSPRREMIQPSQEVTADEKAVKAGFKSRHEVIRESGRDPVEVDRELMEDPLRSKPSAPPEAGEEAA